MAWMGRKNKTYQDGMDRGSRDRVRDWDKRLSFMQNHKPMCSSDWLKLKKA